MPRIRQLESLLSIDSGWFSLLVPGTWEIRAAAAPQIFHGTRNNRALTVATHTLTATPNAELKTLALRGLLESLAKAEEPGSTLEDGPVESSPGGTIVTLSYSLAHAAGGTLARVKMVCYGRRCVVIRLAAQNAKANRETLESLERDVENILDGLTLQQFERVPVRYLQSRAAWLLGVNLFLLCAALLIAAQCYWGGQSVNTASLREKAQTIQDAAAGREALTESIDFFEFWLDRAAIFRREIAAILLVVGGIAVANIATFWWLRKIVRHPWDDIIDRE